MPTYLKLETSFLPMQIFCDTENLISLMIKKQRSAVCFRQNTNPSFPEILAMDSESGVLCHMATELLDSHHGLVINILDF